MDLASFPPPPPWRKELNGESVVYINEVTGEKSDVHPLANYFNQNEASQSVESPLFSASKLSTDEKSESLLFRCEWKEIGLMGNIYSYGMSLCYFPSDYHIEISFDGVDALWSFSRVDGPYGPIDENDLFIGSKITIFDRHLTITSANAHICHLIDTKELVLKKRRAWLQAKIETVGKIYLSNMLQYSSN
jgi:hypothetical protein